MNNFQIDTFVHHDSDTEHALYIQGWYFNDNNRPIQWASFLNGKPLDITQLEQSDRWDVVGLFPDKPVPKECGFAMKINLPKEKGEFILQADGQQLIRLSKKDMENTASKNPLASFVKLEAISGSRWSLSGYAYPFGRDEVKFSVVNAKNDVLHDDFACYDMQPDGFFAPEKGPWGFSTVMEVNPQKEKIWLCIKYRGVSRKIRLLPDMNPWQRMLENFSFMQEEKWAYFKMKGPLHMAAYLARRRPLQYEPERGAALWLEENKLSEKELEQQRKFAAEHTEGPMISIVIPSYQPDLFFLDKLIESLQAQTWPNWQVIFADSSREPGMKEHLDQNWKDEKRIVYIDRTKEEERGISANTNAAIAKAEGEWIGFCDQDDLLSTDALYQVAKAILEHPVGMIYSDEDKVMWHESRGLKDGGQEDYDELTFKPDFSMDFLHTCNYVNHFTVIKKEWIEEAGGLRSEFDGSQDWDLLLRVMEKHGRDEVYHIPRILYHWRKHANSTAGAAGAKNWAFEAGRRALEDHFKRTNQDVSIEDTPYMGRYQIHYPLKKEPMVSIIIPNKDHKDDLQKILDGLMEHMRYENFEVLVVENNSEKPETFSYYQAAQNRWPKLKVLYWDGPFNYSAINNFAARQAKGDYLLLLNNDTAVKDRDFLREMVSNAMRPEAGAVGIKLLYGNEKVQHGGVILGPNGPYHAFLNNGEKDISGHINNVLQRNVIAVTAACLLVSKDKYWQVGGLDEELAVAFNDTDFCLKLYQAGYDNIMLANTTMYHLESVSRGLDNTPEKAKRFRKEQYLLLSRWKDLFEKGDPYYSINLSLIHQTGSFRLEEEKKQIAQIWNACMDTRDMEE